MPFVKIFGVRKEQGSDTRAKIVERIRKEVSSIKELGITEQQVSVKIYSDEDPWSDFPYEVITEVTFFRRNERTTKVKQRMLDTINDIIKEELGGSEMDFSEAIPIVVDDTQDGYAQYRKPEDEPWK